MTFMKAAIADKPDEQFPGFNEPGHNEQDLLLKAGSTHPGKPGTGATPPLVAHAPKPASAGKPATDTPPAAAQTAPATQAGPSSIVKVVVELPANDSPGMPAMPQQSAPYKPTSDVKPAMASPRR